MRISTFGGLMLLACQNQASLAQQVVSTDGVQVGAVFSTSQTASQSFVRFYNNSSSDRIATVDLNDGISGDTLGTWTSPTINAGEALQYSIATLESALGTAQVPESYTLKIDEGFNGLFQHILWRSADGTLTNLSTCSSGATARRQEVAYVHTGTLQDGYPSTLTIHNDSWTTQPASLDIYDARDGARLATHLTNDIPPNGQVILPVSDIEASTGLNPSAAMFHYVVKIENNFPGFLQHTVNNQSAGVITDMTVACDIGNVVSETPISIEEFPLTGADISPSKIIARPNEGVLAHMINSDTITSVSFDGVILPDAMPTDALEFEDDVPNIEIENGPDGEVWFSSKEQIGRIGPQGLFDVYDIPFEDILGFTQPAMTPSSDGEMWFSRFFSDSISRVTQTGAFTHFPVLGLGTLGLQVNSMAVGTDEKVYFTRAFNDQIGRMTNTGLVELFDIPSPYESPINLDQGPDSSMWFATLDTVALGRIDLDGTITMFPMTDPDSKVRNPKLGPDGNIWFVLSDASQIGRMTPSGALTTYDLPTPNADPVSLVYASDGNFWFTERLAGQVGRITPIFFDTTVPGVFASTQQSSQSFLRFINTQDSPQSVTVALSHYQTGVDVGEWVSPAIPANSAQQFFIGTIEDEATVIAPLPDFYSLSIARGFSGQYQHVLWRSSDGTLTNLTSCSSSLSNGDGQISNVHTSILAENYPSSVVITNNGFNFQSPTLGIYDARDGSQLGTYDLPTMATNSQLIIPVTEIEATAGITPTSSMYHYVIKRETDFAGQLQHIVNNQQAGVTTDMTTVCALQ